jgi:hypothetical protein
MEHPLRRLDEGDGLDAGYVEALAAADVFAANQVVAADHVTLGLGEAGTVTLVGSARELSLLAPHQPADFVLTWLPAVGAGHGVGSLFRPFIEKIAFFHPVTSSVDGHGWVPIHPSILSHSHARRGEARADLSIA